jgi:hypothetical protein
LPGAGASRRRASSGVGRRTVYNWLEHDEAFARHGHAQKYSDLLLLALLNAYRPERFRHRKQRRDTDGATVAQVTYDANMKPDDMP